MKNPYLPIVPALLALGAFAFLAPVRADTDDLTKETAAFDAEASVQGGALVTDTLAGRFATFAGSEGNAKSLVTGLRTGSEITLTTMVNGQAATTVFTPRTSPQGYGNVFLSLALAQSSLAAQGITQPTAAEIQAALNGGSITTGTGAEARTVQFNGVLVLRASGEGWGQIAHQLDLNLGRVVSDLHAAHEHIERVDRDHDASRPDRDVLGNKVERPEGIERPERAGPIERPEIPAPVERPERPDLLPHR